MKDSGQGVVGRGAFADGENIFQKVIHLWSSSFAWSNPSKDIDLLRSCFPVSPFRLIAFRIYLPVNLYVYPNLFSFHIFTNHQNMRLSPYDSWLLFVYMAFHLSFCWQPFFFFEILWLSQAMCLFFHRSAVYLTFL